MLFRLYARYVYNRRRANQSAANKKTTLSFKYAPLTMMFDFYPVRRERRRRESPLAPRFLCHSVSCRAIRTRTHLCSPSYQQQHLRDDSPGHVLFGSRVDSPDRCTSRSHRLST